MPTITNQAIDIAPAVAGKRAVTVTGTMTLDACDVGRTFKLEIKL